VILEAEHLRDVRAVNIEVEESHVVPLSRESEREVDGDRGLPYASLPGEDEDDMVHVDFCLGGETLSYRRLLVAVAPLRTGAPFADPVAFFRCLSCLFCHG